MGDCATVKALRSRTRRTSLVSLALAILMSLGFAWPLISSGANLGILDWDVHFLYLGSFFKSIYEYGSPPFWNPWYCGGNVLWQNPQIALLSPAYLLAPWLGLPLAVKWNLALHFFIGFWGMDRLSSRVLRLRSWSARFFLSSVFAFAGGPALHMAVGHMNFVPFLYTPWIFYFFLRALDKEDPKLAVAAAVPSALMIYNGGFHILIMTVLGLGLFVLIQTLVRRRWQGFSLLALHGLAIALFSGPKLLPTFLFTIDPRMLDARGQSPLRDFVSDRLMLKILADPSTAIDSPSPGFPWGWWEYGHYIGFAALSLILAAAVFTALVQRRRRVTVALGLGSLLTMLFLFYISKGDYSPQAPSHWLQLLPVFNKFRIPSRYILVSIFYGLLMTGWAFARMERLLPRQRAFRSAAGVLFVLAGLAPWAVNRQHLAQAFPSAPLSENFSWLSRPPAPQANLTPNAEYGQMYPSMMRNQSVPACYEPMQVLRTHQSDRELVYTDPGARIEDVRFQPHRIKVIVHSEAGTKVYFNQNVIQGWTASVPGGLEFDAEQKVFFAQLPPGRAQVVFRFWPPGLGLGFGLLFLGVLLSCGLWWHGGRRRLSAP